MASDDLGLSTVQDLLTLPTARPQDMTSQQIQAVRSQLDNSLFLFAYLIFGFRGTPHFHGPMCQFLANWGKGPEELSGGSRTGWKRLCVEVPRDCGKTSVGTRANALWQVARSPGHNATVAIFNAKEDNASKWLKAIREVVEASHLFHLCYRSLLPPGIGNCCWPDHDPSRPKTWKWNNVEIQFARTGIGIPEASITGLGIGGAATGGHWTHLIADDIIGLEESRSVALMAAAKDWTEAARFLESPAEGGNVLYIYTRWHFDDCYRYIHEGWPDEYVLFHREALEDEGLPTEHSSFPEKWTTEKLQDVRKRNPYFFASQLQSTPRAGKETSLDPAWNRDLHIDLLADDVRFSIPNEHYAPLRHEHEDQTVTAPQVVHGSQCDGALLWDPAPSEQRDRNKDSRARNGKVVVFLDPWGRDFVAEARGTQTDPLDEFRDTIRLAAKWGISKIAVEEVNFSKVYKHVGEYLLQREFPTLRDKVFFVKLKEERAQKDTRILGLIPRWRAGHSYFGPEAKAILVEANEYPFGRTRDLLDAYAMRQKVLRMPYGVRPGMLKERELARQFEVTGRDQITGY